MPFPSLRHLPSPGRGEWPARLPSWDRRLAGLRPGCPALVWLRGAARGRHWAHQGGSWCVFRPRHLPSVLSNQHRQCGTSLSHCPLERGAEKTSLRHLPPRRPGCCSQAALLGERGFQQAQETLRVQKRDDGLGVKFRNLPSAQPVSLPPT